MRIFSNYKKGALGVLSTWTAETNAFIPKISIAAAIQEQNFTKCYF